MSRAVTAAMGSRHLNNASCKTNIDLGDIISNLSASHPGQHALITHLATLLTTTAPPFIHIHTPFAPRRTTALVVATLRATHTPHAHLHGVQCVTQRLVFDRVLAGLAGWEPTWDEGGGCVPFGGLRYNTDPGAFVEGVRAVADALRLGKEKASDADAGVRMVIVLERAENLRVKDLMVPLARLAELSGEPVTTLLISEVSWFDIRPPLGAAPDPLLIDVPILSKQDTISTLVSFFPSRSPDCTGISAYTPHLKPLYAQYVAALHSVCSPFLVDVHELAYVAAACWPAFVAPVLAEWRAGAEGPDRDGAETDGGQGEVMEHDKDEQMTQDDDEPMPQNRDDPTAHAQHTLPHSTQPLVAAPTSTQSLPPFTLPSEDARMRLVRYFTPSFTRALEALYPRTQHATQWAAGNAPPAALKLSELLGSGGRARGPDAVQDQGKPEGQGQLTTVAKYVLVASFLASYNPPKSDVRMVGRAPDERGQKRRRGGPRKLRGGGGTARVSQRLLGPAAFPLDRLLAIVGSLMEEHDAGVPRLPSFPDADDDSDDADYAQETDTEMAVWRTQVSATIAELVAMRLLHRTTPGDRLQPTFKCGVSQARAFELARDLWAGSLADFMCEVN